jgi:LytS/YehU family sensor histidine kinase
MRKRTLFWQLQIGGWIAFMAVMQPVLRPYATWRVALPLTLLRGFAGFLFTLGLREIYTRWDLERKSMKVLGLQALFWVGLTSAVDALITQPLLDALHLPNLLPAPDSGIVGTFSIRAGVYLGWSILYFWLKLALMARDKELRIAQIESAAHQAELSLLRAQVNPHFLFNSLNSILAEIDDHPHVAKTLTQSLSNYLHFSLAQSGEVAPLQEELEALSEYLGVEKVRFGEDFEYRIDVSPEARSAPVPPAVLQPLVENAIKYGSETSPAPLQVGIRAETHGRQLLLAVTNTGEWVDQSARDRQSTGIGLANLRRRLELLYNGQAHLECRKLAGSVEVAVRLPI